jgi:hypothetical protein
MMAIRYAFLISILVLLFSVTAIADESNDIDLKHDHDSENSSLMPNYGNWCGLNHPKDINKAAEPIDDLDTICQAHDYCYLEKGYLSCECDSDFTDSIALGLRQNKFIGKEKLFSHTFRAYFKNSPCSGDHSNKLAPTRTVQNVVHKAGTVTKGVIGKLPFVGGQVDDTPKSEDATNNQE